MRNIVFVITLLAIVFFLYTRRYKILNTILAINGLRKILLSFVLNSPLGNTRFVSRFFHKV